MLIDIKNSSKFALIKQGICLLTLFAFIFTNIGLDPAWAAVQSTQSEISAIEIPAYLGYIKNSWQSGAKFIRNSSPGLNPGYTVIHIQDAHCDYKAQNSIYELIDYLQKRYGARVVNLEGGEGPYDLSAFRRIRDAAIREKTADYLMKEGVLNGSEFYAVKNPGKVSLWGVEDTSLYRANLEVYKRSLAHKDEADRALKSINYILSLLKARAYGKELIELDLKINSLKERKLDIREYLGYLINRAAAKGIDAKDLVNIGELAGVADLEKAIDFRKSTAERDELVEKLTKYLPRARARELAAEALEFRMGRLAPREFYNYLLERARDADIDMTEYGDLARYVGYITAYEKVRREELFKEIARLEERIKDKLYTDPVQRKLDRLSKDLAIVKNIFNINTTPDEFNYYNAHRSDFDFDRFVDFIRATSPRYNVAVPGMPDTGRMNGYLSGIERFYALSYKRDEAFIKNLSTVIASPVPLASLGCRAKQSNNDFTILVTGGFHTDNLMGILRKRNISYVSIMPNFGLDNSPSPYFRRLAGEMPAIFRAVSPGVSTMAIYTYFCEKAREIYGDDIGRMRDDAIRAASELIADGKDIYATLPGRDTPTPPAGAAAGFINTKLLYTISAIFFVVLAFIMPFLNSRPVYAAGQVTTPPAALANILSADERNSMGEKLKGVAGEMWKGPAAGIFEGDKATDKPYKVEALASRAADYFQNIPQALVEEYQQYTEKMAGFPKNAWIIFAALELTESSGGDVLEKDKIRLVLSPDGGRGPLQVMKRQATGVNEYVDAREANRKAGKYIGYVDQSKIKIIKLFGFSSEVHIDLDKLDPLSKEYDSSYARLVGALIFALDYDAFYHHYFQINDKGEVSDELAWGIDRPEDRGFDAVLAAIVAYNLGYGDAKGAVESTGPWFGVDRIEWYKKFISGIEKKITQSHNVRFKTFLEFIFYIFPDNPDLRVALASLGYGVDFLEQEGAPPAPVLTKGPQAQGPEAAAYLQEAPVEIEQPAEPMTIGSAIKDTLRDPAVHIAFGIWGFLTLVTLFPFRWWLNARFSRRGAAGRDDAEPVAGGSRVSQIGHESEVIMIKGPMAWVKNSDNNIVPLELHPALDVTASIIDEINLMDDLEDSHRELVIAVLRVFAELPGESKPAFRTFKPPLIDDLCGFAFISERSKCLALYEAFEHDPLAFFHEVAEYLVKLESIKIDLDEDRITLTVGEKKYDPITLSKEALKIAYQNPHNPHYLIRALQREIFKGRDANLTRRIRHEQKYATSILTRISTDILNSRPARRIIVFFARIITPILRLLLAGAGSLLATFENMTREYEPRKKGLKKSLFMDGSIYDYKFIEQERADPRFTVVFDMDDAIVWGSRRVKDAIYMRPGLGEALEELKYNNKDVKLVLWTSAPRDWTEQVLQSFPPEIVSCFDLVITYENWMEEGDMRTIMIRRQYLGNLSGRPFKNIAMLGYDVLVDDEHNFNKSEFTEQAKRFGFEAIIVPFFNFDNMVHGEKVDKDAIEDAMTRDDEIGRIVLPKIISILPQRNRGADVSQIGKNARVLEITPAANTGDRIPPAVTLPGIEAPPVNPDIKALNQGFQQSVVSGDLTTGYMAQTARDIAASLADSYVMVKPCTVGIAIKVPGPISDSVADRLVYEVENIVRHGAQDILIKRDIIQDKVENVTYVAYVDDGSGSEENMNRMKQFKERLLEKASNQKEKPFAWVVSSELEGPDKVKREKVISDLHAVANLVGLRGDYLPISWQMLVGPQFANLIDSKEPGPEGIRQDRIDAIVDAIVASISRMTRTDISEWATLRDELKSISASELARKLNGISFYLKLPPMEPLSGAIEQYRKSDLEVVTAL